MVVTMERWCRGDGVDVVVRVAVKMMMTTVLWWWRGDDDEPVGGVSLVEAAAVVEVITTAAKLRWGSRSDRSGIDLHICIFLGWRLAATTMAGGWPEIGGCTRS
ncbi:hypothetical protein Tco_0764895 [Tanacetum coccineum]